MPQPSPSDIIPAEILKEQEKQAKIQTQRKGMIINDVHDKWELGCKNFDINKLDEIITTGLFKFVTWHQTREFQNKGKKLKYENIDYVCKTTKLTKEI